MHLREAAGTLQSGGEEIIETKTYADYTQIIDEETSIDESNLSETLSLEWTQKTKVTFSILNTTLFYIKITFKI